MMYANISVGLKEPISHVILREPKRPKDLHRRRIDSSLRSE
jgi:hypothetical protein